LFVESVEITDINVTEGHVQFEIIPLIPTTVKRVGSHLIAWQRPFFERSKSHFTAIIYAQKATNAENFVKIGLDFLK